MMFPARRRSLSVRIAASWGVFRVFAAAVLLTGAAGCGSVRTLIIGSNTGPKLDRGPDRPRKPVDRRVRKMTVAITTDPGGQIVDVRFVQSSGSEGVDGFVRESIRSSFPGQAQPNAVTTVTLTYSADDGFSEPKVINVQPF